MKRILDRLMARQQALLSSLDSPPPRVRMPERSAEELEVQRGLDAAAVDEAFTLLAAGQLDSAAERLRPLVDNAQDSRVHTTLARIDTMQGNFEAAHQLLAQAARLAPTDQKVVYVTAELLHLQGRFVEEVQLRRRAVFSTTEASADACVRLLTALAKASAGSRRPALAEVRLALNRLRAAPDATPSHRLEAARAIFGLPGFEQEGLALHRTDDPPKSDERDVIVAWTSLRTWSARHPEVPLHRITAFGAPGRRPQLAQLKGATLVPGFQWLPLVDQGRTVFKGLTASRVRFHAENTDSPLVMAGPARALFRLPAAMPRIAGPVIVLGGNGNYYHDLVEYVGALAVPETLGLGADIQLLVSDPLPRHLEELFGLLGIDERRLLRWKPTQPVLVDELWLPTRLAAGGRWFDPLLPHWYRQRLAPYLSPRPAHRRLYVSRAGTSRRRVHNEDQVLAAIEPLGFECVRPETLSLREQVALFSQAESIVGSSGAGLTNMLFTPPGARIVVLHNRHLVEGQGDLYFDALASTCAHHAINLACTPTKLDPGDRAIDADLTVDCDALAARLQAALISTDSGHRTTAG